MSFSATPDGQPAYVEVRRVEFGTEYRVGAVQLVVDDNGIAVLLVHVHAVPIGAVELRALRALLNYPVVIALFAEK